MAQVDVRCTVSSCHYWAQGNNCDARAIVISSDSAASSLPASVDAMQASTLSATPVHNAMQTTCKTFVPRNGDHSAQRADQITRS